jgi:hypothetical protein
MCNSRLVLIPLEPGVNVTLLECCRNNWPIERKKRVY